MPAHPNPEPRGARASKRRPRCPICRAPVDSDAEAFPFCCQRCKLIDLGRWLGGEYRVEVPVEHSDWGFPIDDPTDSGGTP